MNTPSMLIDPAEDTGQEVLCHECNTWIPEEDPHTCQCGAGPECLPCSNPDCEDYLP